MKLTLPSGRRVALGGLRETGPAQGLFAEARAAVVTEDGAPVDVGDLTLADFHVVRALLTKSGEIAEEDVTIDCHNCSTELTVRPCARLETGPWRDGELDDPELDETPDFGEPLSIAPIAIGRVRSARTVTLAPRHVREVLPLYEALASPPLVVDARVVEAMGIVALGELRDPERIARALARARADAHAFASVTDAFLDAHYPPRLAADVFCPTCKARNVVDAPYEREFERGAPAAVDDGARALPPLEAFVELAHAIADPLIAAIPGERVELVVEPGVPAVDDGGEPLLGSYVPPPPADAPVPIGPPRVTIYYRTFEAADREDEGFDWEDELHETIEHELEHHVFFLRGHDPMDEEEHAEIDRDVLRVVGRQEAARRELAGFGASIPEFLVRGWPLLVIGALAALLALAEGRCN